jgi:hypothetical protein
MLKRQDVDDNEEEGFDEIDMPDTLELGNMQEFDGIEIPDTFAPKQSLDVESIHFESDSDTDPFSAIEDLVDNDVCKGSMTVIPPTDLDSNYVLSQDDESSLLDSSQGIHLSKSFDNGGVTNRITAIDTAEDMNELMKELNCDKKDQPAVPTLIQKVKPTTNKPRLITKTDFMETRIGNMIFNPTKNCWEGNDQDLKAFEKTKSSRPKLIKHSKLLLPDKIGDMTFDPVSMCWIGNEQELDIFQDIPQLNNTRKVGKIYFNIVQGKHNAFIITKILGQKLSISESSHRLFMGAWYPFVVQTNRLIQRDTSKTFLYEIRSIK